MVAFLKMYDMMFLVKVAVPEKGSCSRPVITVPSHFFLNFLTHTISSPHLILLRLLTRLPSFATSLQKLFTVAFPCRDNSGSVSSPKIPLLNRVAILQLLFPSYDLRFIIQLLFKNNIAFFSMSNYCFLAQSPL
jgi:hypothetical protein